MFGLWYTMMNETISFLISSMYHFMCYKIGHLFPNGEWTLLHNLISDIRTRSLYLHLEHKIIFIKPPPLFNFRYSNDMLIAVSLNVYILTLGFHPLLISTISGIIWMNSSAFFNWFNSINLVDQDQLLPVQMDSHQLILIWPNLNYITGFQTIGKLHHPAYHSLFKLWHRIATYIIPLRPESMQSSFIDTLSLFYKNIPKT